MPHVRIEEMMCLIIFAYVMVMEKVVAEEGEVAAVVEGVEYIAETSFWT